MKIRAERKALAETITWVAQATPKRVNVPALSGVHLTATADGRLVARAFDYDTSHGAVVNGVDVIEPGEVLIPAAFLRNVLTGFKAAQVEIVLDGKTVTVSSGRSTYSCRVLALGDYPTLPAVPPVKGFIEADALRELVATAAWAIDPDIHVDVTMAGITACHIEGDIDGALTFVGTDRFVVSEAVTTWAGNEAIEANVPLGPLAAAAKGLNGMVALAHEGGLFGLSDGDRTITTRTIEAGFPAWRPLMRPATDDDGAWTTDGPELVAAIKRTQSLIDEKSALVFEADEELTLTIPSSEAGEGVEYLDAEHVDGNLAASFRMDPTMIGPALTALAARSVRIGWKQGTKPVTLRSDDRPGVTMLVMPKRDMGGAR